jgi:hypothetical protein
VADFIISAVLTSERATNFLKSNFDVAHFRISFKTSAAYREYYFRLFSHICTYLNKFVI